MTSPAARTIQRAWRLTSTRLGRLGSNFNENRPISISQFRNVPLSRLYHILLYSAGRRNQNWRYEMRPNGLYYIAGTGHPVRMTRPMVLSNISEITNVRLSPRKNAAARTIQKYRRAQILKRRLALTSSLRQFLPPNLRRKVVS
jgi:hypothetical protein